MFPGPKLLVMIAGLWVAEFGAHSDPGMFRGSPAHSGIYDSTAPSLGKLQWKFHTSGKVLSSPLAEGASVYVGSTDHYMYAIDRESGAERWKFRTGGPVNSSPASLDGVIFFGSVDGNFYAVDEASGKLKWKFATQGERRFTAPGIHGAIPRTQLMADPFDVFLSSPAIAGGVVYFGSGDGNVYALDAATGSEKWKFRTGDVVHASPAVADGKVFIGSWDRNLYALDAGNGREIWRYQTGNDTTIYNQIGIASSAAVVGGIVFVGCRDGHFYAVDEKTGALRWSHDNQGGWVIASPAVKNGTVYFPTSDGTKFKALDAKSGALRYSVVNKAISFSSPAIVGDVAYFGSSDGWLHAVDLATGAMKAEFQTDGSRANLARYIDENGRMQSSKLYDDFTIDGMFVGLERMFTLGSILSSPVIADGTLYVGSTDGNLYALK
jgi:outer membrane protein assembly factor BamB